MDTLKKAVQDRYGKIARASSEAGGCCGTSSSCCDDKTSSRSPEEYDANLIREFSSADLGLGCGTPTERAELQPGMTVLDLGSGAGLDAFIASKRVGATGKVIGIDITEEMIRRAKENTRALGLTNVEFHLGDIEQMPVASGSVDRVISNCVLNLVPDKAKAFAEIYRVLAPGGAFVVSDVVSRGAVPEDIRNDPELWAGCVAGASDLEDYLRIISSAGFTSVEVLSQRSRPAPSAGAYEMLSLTVKGVKA